MDYLVLNSNSRVEYRLYLTEPQEELPILYQGHKLGISDSILDEVINYKIEMSTQKLFFLKYDIWLTKYSGQNPNIQAIDLWKSSNLENKSKELWEIWESLLQHLRSQNGNFRNIWIVKINI